MLSFLVLCSILLQTLSVSYESGLIVITDQFDQFIASIEVERNEQIGIALDKAANAVMTAQRYSSAIDIQFNYAGCPIQELADYENESTTLSTLNINPFDDYCKIEFIPIRNKFLTYNRTGLAPAHLSIKIYILDEIEVKFGIKTLDIGEGILPLISTSFFALSIVPDFDHFINRHQLSTLMILQSTRPKTARLQFTFGSKYHYVLRRFHIIAESDSYIDLSMKITNNYVDIKLNHTEQRICHEFTRSHGLSNISINSKSNRSRFTFVNNYHLLLRDVSIRSTQGPKFISPNRPCIVM